MKKTIYLIIGILVIVFITSCTTSEHNCMSFQSEWQDITPFICGENGSQQIVCLKCNKVLDTRQVTKEHNYYENIIKEVTCTEDGLVENICQYCGDTHTITQTKYGHLFTEETISDATCTKGEMVLKTCERCNYSYETEVSLTAKGHDYEDIILQEVTCTQDELIKRHCKRCNDTFELIGQKAGHVEGEMIVVEEPTETSAGKKAIVCTRCNQHAREFITLNNGYEYNGKLSVKGPDLVNQYGEKFQLYGLSTHGLQWFGRYTNFDTIAAIQQGFGNNIIRLALYTSESGYCSGNPTIKQQMYDDLCRGIDAATKLGLYVIVDWHMVGAANILDKNPLTFVEESKEFFSEITLKYKHQNNILYEIMNEPNGSTTWDDCKEYANQVIPCIRKNTDAIVLVGNPRWTADLYSVMADPLVGYDNIMYTYHFYAADHRNTTQVETAYDKGFPVFISEFGFMNSSGDGNISTKYGERWKTVLDERNISYVAWNISNSKGSASIFKEASIYMSDISDANLKTWGIYLKNWYRSKSGLDKIMSE